jgi:hypothetical protein
LSATNNRILQLRDASGEMLMPMTFTDEQSPTLAQLGLWDAGQVSRQAERIVGQALYNGLGREGRATLEQIRDHAISEGLAINYALRFSPETQLLAALPWEVLSNESELILFKGGSDLDSCERYFG